MTTGDKVWAWRWVQPKDRAELLQRLADARDLAVPERERENLCACAYTDIKVLEDERDALKVDLTHEVGFREQAEAALAQMTDERDALIGILRRCEPFMAGLSRTHKSLKHEAIGLYSDIKRALRGVRP